MLMINAPTFVLPVYYIVMLRFVVSYVIKLNVSELLVLHAATKSVEDTILKELAGKVIVYLVFAGRVNELNVKLIASVPMLARIIVAVVVIDSGNSYISR